MRRMSTSADAFVAEVRTALARAAVPADAEPMRAYMKSALPFFGVKKPARKTALAPRIAATKGAAIDDVVSLARTLFVGATHREERYAATDLLRAHRRHLRARHLDALDELVRVGAWWDHVDEIAAHLVGAILRAEPEKTRERLLAWATHDDLWLRRTAILAQLTFRDGVDRELLAACIAPSTRRPELWLRKAIGWALRNLSRHDPAWVRSYVEQHPELSALSRKEALRRV